MDWERQCCTLQLRCLSSVSKHFTFGVNFGHAQSLNGVIRHFVVGLTLYTGLVDVDQDLDVFEGGMD